MKKIYAGTLAASLGCVATGLFIATTYFNGNCMNSLSSAPAHIETFKEIAVLYDTELAQFYNKLLPEERVFSYYLFRASLPGNRIAADQTHRDALAIKEMYTTIFDHEAELVKIHDQKDSALNSVNIQKFIQEAKTFLVYLWGSHSQYFAREHANEKRTPTRLGLGTLTKENFIAVFKELGRKDLADKVIELEKSLFDHSYESTVTVPNSIEHSAVNIYSYDFTEQDYQRLSPQDRDKINAYFCIIKQGEHRIPTMVPYALNSKYNNELSVAIFWLKKAHKHAQKHPTIFDEHVVKSLELLIAFLQTGEEDYFKKHSIQWLKSSSRIEYNFGFIETYHDPKSKRGHFQAEVTIRTIDLAQLNAILPSIEQKLPLSAEFKRKTLGTPEHTIPNASINTKIFGTGGLGPMLITAAYCLPNYDDIRATHGSKQIIYPATKSLGAILNPNLAHKLFYPKEMAEWLDEHDPDWSFSNDLLDVQCILHETLGHGSGQLADHVFREGDVFTIGGKQYAVGDSIAVTHENIAEFLHGYEATIEELRAEIIALYVSVVHLDALMKAGFLTSWYKKIGRDELVQWLILHMANTGLKRIIQQSDDATEISGDHARANSTITNYLIEKGGIALNEETIRFDSKEYTVIGLSLVDADAALKAITELMQEVQRIKSTGDGIAAQTLIDTYGRRLNQRHLKILKDNEKTVTGDLKARVFIAPHFIPIVDEQGSISDVRAEWPKNIFEQFKTYAQLEMSKE